LLKISFSVSKELWPNETIQINCTEPEIAPQKKSLTIEVSGDKNQFCTGEIFMYDWIYNLVWPHSNLAIVVEDFSSMTISLTPQIFTADDSLRKMSPEK
jgi:hypothetical protein